MSKQQTAIASALQTNPLESELQTTTLALQDPTFSGESQASSLEDLGRALGMAGSVVTKGLEDQEKRNEKFGVYKAEQLIKGMNDEDMKRLNAVDMIGTVSTDMQLQDNPYAIAHIEKMRGLYLANAANDEYQQWRQDQPKTTSATEELARYQKFMGERYTEYGGTAINKEAFDVGYNDKRQANELVLANQQRTEQTKELQAISKGTTQANLTNLVRNYGSLGEEAFLGKFQEYLNDTRLTWMEPSARTELVKQALHDFATGPAKPEILTKIAGLTLGTKPDGTNVKVGGEGGLLDMNPYYTLANQTQANQFGPRVSSALQALQKMDHNAQNKQFAEWESQDPDFFKTMSNYRKSAFDYYDREQAKAQKAALRMQANNAAQAQMAPNIQRQLQAWIAGNLMDSGGIRVATSPGDLPKIEVMEADENGNMVRKTMPYDPRVLDGMCTQAIQQRLAEGGDEDQKMRDIMRIVAFPGFKNFQESVKNQLDGSLQSLRADEIQANPEGWVNANQNLMSTLKWYRSNSEDFQKVFGETTTMQVHAVQSLADANGGDYAQGLAMFSKGRDVLRDKGYRDTKETEIKKDMYNNPISGFDSLDGSSSKASTNTNTNAYLNSLIVEQRLFLEAGGMEPGAARASAEAAVRQNFGAYRDTMIPYGFFNGVPADNDQKVKVGKVALDGLVQEFANSVYGGDPTNITVTYIPDKRTVMLSAGSGQVMPITMNSLNYYANQQAQWAAKARQEAIDNNRPTPEQIQQEREAARTLPENGVTETVDAPPEVPQGEAARVNDPTLALWNWFKGED